MKTSFLIPILLLLFPGSVFSNSCAGRGTVFFYGNGMFNTKKEARESLDFLSVEIENGINLENSKNIKYELAYKTSEPVLNQIINVVSQKEVDNYENFWFLLSSNKMAPQWFQDTLRMKVADAIKNASILYDELGGQLDDYASYMQKGYNVILISHSQGNLYANQAMLQLDDFTDAGLNGSISDRRKGNSLFPKFFDIFANVQVATPVKKTINSSPWTTFKDDLVMMLVRET